MSGKAFEDRPDASIRSVGDALARILTGMGPATAIMAVHRVWDEVVGDGVAAHCQPIRVDGDVLVVEVDQPGWATEVRYLQRTILDRLNDRVADLDLASMRISVSPNR